MTHQPPKPVTPHSVTEAGFTLHPQLAADTASILDWPVCRVLLMRDARFPWLILVPRRADAVELIDLNSTDQAQVWREISAAGAALRTLHTPDKLNIGALGNMVRQLHIHIVARRVGDAAWPGPVWGSGPAYAYQLPLLNTRIAELREALAQMPL